MMFVNKKNDVFLKKLSNGRLLIIIMKQTTEVCTFI